MVDVKDHYNAVADTYYQQYQRENLKALADYPANYFRLQILIQRMAQAGVKSAYEVGVGEGTPLATMASLGLKVAGCDISDSMVQQARETFRRHGLSPDLIQWGDVQDATTIAAQVKQGPFDAVMALGVLPHVRNDNVMLQNLGMMIPKGGKIFVEFRNKLFSLFTFNRYTKEFILDDLLANVPAAVKDVVAADLDKRLAVNLPPVRDQEKNGAPGYDSILAKFHNPFELLEVFEKNGFHAPRLHWYHYHPAAPMLEGVLGSAFRDAAFCLEHEGSWRGMFLCSAGVIEATKG
jgi:2-polyprenyl-3-methyl-5-hydroxy-6-metoxy-1,4-benzoquinol methylase